MNENTPLATQTSLHRCYDEDKIASLQQEDELELVKRQPEQNNYTPSPDYGDHESFNFALMTIFLLGGCGAALAMIPILVSCESHTKTFVSHVYDILYLVITCFIGLLTLFCGFSIIRRKKWLTDGRLKVDVMGNTVSKNFFQSSEQPKLRSGYVHLHQLPAVSESSMSRSGQKTFPYAVVAFGIGSFLYLVCVLIYHGMFSLVKSQSNFYFSKLFDKYHLASDILYLVANSTLIVFVTKYKGVTLHSCVMFHYFIALMIGGGVFIWLSVTLNPVCVFITESCYNASTYDEGNSTVAKKVAETILGFLKPFHVEFVTICIGIFLNLWNRFENTSVKPESVDSRASRENPDNLNNVNRQSIEKDTSESKRRCCDTKASNYRVKRRLIFSIPLLLSLCYVSLFVIGHYDDDNQLSNIYLWNGIRVLMHLLLLLFFISTCRAMRKYKLRLKCSSITCSEIVLVGTHTVNYVYFFFRFFATLSLLSAHESNGVGKTKLVFIMIYSGLCMVDIWGATFYILAMKSLQRSGRKMTNFDKFGLIYNASVHVSEWAVTGLSHEWALQSTHHLVPALAVAFGDVSIRLLTLVVFPIIEFYRFHAAVVCFEIGKNGW